MKRVKPIAIAIINSWKKFCKSINNTRDSARLSKVLDKGHSNPTNVKRVDGSWSESVDILLKDILYTDVRKDLITPEYIAWAIGSFSPNKSLVIDGILPKMLQSAWFDDADANNLS